MKKGKPRLHRQNIQIHTGQTKSILPYIIFLSRAYEFVGLPFSRIQLYVLQYICNSLSCAYPKLHNLYYGWFLFFRRLSNIHIKSGLNKHRQKTQFFNKPHFSIFLKGHVILFHWDIYSWPQNKIISCHTWKRSCWEMTVMS